MAQTWMVYAAHPSPQTPLPQGERGLFHHIRSGGLISPHPLRGAYFTKSAQGGLFHHIRSGGLVSPHPLRGACFTTSAQGGLIHHIRSVGLISPHPLRGLISPHPLRGAYFTTSAQGGFVAWYEAATLRSNYVLFVGFRTRVNRRQAPIRMASFTAGMPQMQPGNSCPPA